MLVVLTILTLGLIWFNNQAPSSGVDKDHFKVDVQQADKVVLKSNGDTVVLEYNGTRWKVNGNWYADRELIDVLFATLQQAAPRRPVAASQEDSLYQELEKSGVAVEVFVKGQLVGHFLAGGNAAKTQAYFARTDDRNVYIMNIPGYRVYVSGIFELDESGWREKRVFAFNWQNFQRLDAHFPANARHDFSMTMDNMQIAVPGIADIDTGRVNNFLDAVSLLTVEQYHRTTPALDSLLSVEPIQILTVSDIGNRKFTLKLYSAPSEQMKGLINDNQWADFDARKIRQILVPKDFFARH